MRNPNPKKPVIFLDRDGVLNVDSGYVYKVKDLVLMPGVALGLRQLADEGFELAVITNQSGVARGYFTLDQVHTFHEALRDEVLALGGPRLEHFYICPHHPEGMTAPFNIACSCRKPAPGLLEEAIKALDADRERSFFFGDKPSDVQCGHNAGIKTVQIVGDRYEKKESADAVVRTFEEAVAFVRTQVKTK